MEKVLAEVIGGPLAVSSDRLSRRDLDGETERPRVLVADDSRVARGQIQRVLDQLSVDCTLVADGREALRHLQGMADQGIDVCDKYTMLISDIEMPDMDGYTLTTEIRRDPRLAELYILLHTSLSGVFNNAMVERVGANKFVPKYSPDELADSVLERLEMRVT